MPGSVRRSWLMVPCDDAAGVEQAAAAVADVIVLDLMEFVPERSKPEARERLPETIAALAQGASEVFVQVDKELLYADLCAVVWPGLSGILIPHLEAPEEITEADGLLTQMEGTRGLRPGTLQIIAVLDTAKGNYHGLAILRASRRVWGVTLGRADLVMDLRPEPSGEIHLMPYLMQRLIILANAAAVVPLGAWWRAPARGLWAGPADTHSAAVRGRRIGFKGALCLRPDQVEPLNRGFRPSSAEEGAGRALIGAYESRDNHETAVIRLQDRVVDLAAVLQCKQLLTDAEACAGRDSEKTQAPQRTAR
jgi:citrate lyase subunit beta / citryl-CoA lyase